MQKNKNGVNKLKMKIRYKSNVPDQYDIATMSDSISTCVNMDITWTCNTTINFWPIMWTFGVEGLFHLTKWMVCIAPLIEDCLIF
jgi:hypothetical protein